MPVPIAIDHAGRDTIFPAHDVARRERMVTPHRQCETIGQERRPIEFGIFTWNVGDAEFHVAIPQSGNDLVPRDFLERDAHHRVFTLEGREHERHETQSHGRHAGDRDVTATMLAQIAQVLELMIEIGQQALDAGQEIRADLAELNAARGAVEQPHLQFILQLPDSLAQRGLRHAERPCRTAEAAGLHDRDESSQLPQVHIYHHN